MKRFCLKHQPNRRGFSLMEAVIALTVVVIVTMAAITIFDVTLDRAETGNDLGDARAAFDNVLSAYQFAGTLNEFCDALPIVGEGNKTEGVVPPGGNQGGNTPAEPEEVHKHTIQKFEAVAADCLMPGYDTYYACLTCSDWFADAQGTSKITDHSSIYHAAEGHRMNGTGVCAVCGAHSSIDSKETVGQFYDLFKCNHPEHQSIDSFGYSACPSAQYQGGKGVEIPPSVTRTPNMNTAVNESALLNFLNGGNNNGKVTAVVAANLAFEPKLGYSAITYLHPYRSTNEINPSYIVYKLEFPDKSRISSFEYTVYGCIGMNGSKNPAINVYMTTDTVNADNVKSYMRSTHLLKTIKAKSTGIYGPYSAKTGNSEQQSYGTYQFSNGVSAVYIIVELVSSTGNNGDFIRYTGIQLDVEKEGLDAPAYQVTEIPYRAATCDSVGNYLYYTCDNPQCAGKYYRDYACTRPYDSTASTVIPKKSHNWAALGEVNAQGNQEYRCTLCQKTKTEYQEVQEEVIKYDYEYVVGSNPTYRIDVKLSILSTAKGQLNGTNMTVTLTNKNNGKVVDTRHVQR